MCGIVGIFNFDREKKVEINSLKKMSDPLVHRGPDGEGFFVDKNVGLGHRRLEIIDLDTGGQPMHSADGQLVIIFNGEIYNFVELRRILVKKGYEFKTSSDTEVILNAYLEWGPECQNRLNGMWAFAIWDKRKQTLFLSRDRIGEKPLYFSQFKNTLYFGSEIKSLFGANVPREINEEMTEIYLCLSTIPGKDTFFKNVSKLLPGTFLLVNNDGWTHHKYWDLPEIDEANMNSNKYAIYEEFSHLLRDSVKIRMRSDVPFGAFLSGGLDSSSVVALMSKESSSPIETFTIGFKEKLFDESDLAGLVSSRYSTNHNLGFVTSASLSFYLEKVRYHFDEPFGDNSAIPTFQVSEFAREKVKMVLTGDGGDEVMSGYPTYAGLKYLRAYSNIPSFFRRSLESGLAMGATLSSSSWNKKLSYLHRMAVTANLTFADSVCHKKPFVSLHTIKKITKDMKNLVTIEDFMSDYTKKIPYEDLFYKHMFFDLKTRLPDGYLTKVDRMSMANSIETRAPFLDHRLIEFLVQVDKDVKIENYKTKPILKNTIGKKLPRQLLNARKKGFVTPLDEWFRSGASVGLFQKLSQLDWNLHNQTISDLIELNRSNTGNNGLFLWQLLVLGKHYEEN